MHCAAYVYGWAWSQITKRAVSWFLNQKVTCSGFLKAIFFATVLVRIIRDYVLPHRKLEGLYNLAATLISKFNLLWLISDIYNTGVTGIPDNNIKINLLLNASKFNAKTHYALLRGVS